MHYFLKITGMFDQGQDFQRKCSERGDDLLKKIENMNETESKMLGC